MPFKEHARATDAFDPRDRPAACSWTIWGADLAPARASNRVILRLQDIIDNADAVFGYTQGMDLTAFEADRRTYDAVERCLERISEPAAKLGDQAAVLMPGQPWHKVRAFGNVLRHEYDAIREDALFEIVRGELPGLRAAAAEALRVQNLNR